MSTRIFLIEWINSGHKTRVIARNAREAISKAIYKERNAEYYGWLHDIESVTLESEA